MSNALEQLANGKEILNHLEKFIANDLKRWVDQIEFDLYSIHLEKNGQVLYLGIGTEPEHHGRLTIMSERGCDLTDGGYTQDKPVSIEWIEWKGQEVEIDEHSEQKVLSYVESLCASYMINED